MLVLTRNEEQSIIIGDNREVVIKVLGISGRQVKLGIEADKKIPVHREEIYEAILKNSAASAA